MPYYDPASFGLRYYEFTYTDRCPKCDLLLGECGVESPSEVVYCSQGWLSAVASEEAA